MDPSLLICKLKSTSGRGSIMVIPYFFGEGRARLILLYISSMDGGLLVVKFSSGMAIWALGKAGGRRHLCVVNSTGQDHM